MTEKLLAGVETGGTKIVCAVASSDVPERIRAQTTIRTGEPKATLGLIERFLRDAAPHGVTALGLASFGPIDPDPASTTYGFITESPKQAWANFDIVGAVTDRIGHLPVSFVTDVVGAAIGEAAYGAGRGARRMAYLTIGTGVGAGVLIDGRPLLGVGYPEVGHLSVKRYPGDLFPGVCPFHGDCAEGLISGPAIAARFGSQGADLGEASSQYANKLVAFYATQVISALRYALGIDWIILGGGVASRAGAPKAIRAQAQREAAAGGGVDHLTVVASALGDRAGVLGALKLAHDVAS